MFNPFAHSEQNLGRAGWLLILELAGAVAAGMMLSGFGVTTDYIFIGVWLFNLLPAWYISRGARSLGKSPWLYGAVSALAPAGAIAAWTWLYSQDYWQLLERKHGRSSDEA
jgi:hypothetical protein